jgi:hypothetical protein
MGIRKANRKTTNRKDGSVAQLPIPSPTVATAIAGGVNLHVAAGVLANAGPDAPSVGDVYLKNTAGTFTDGQLIVTQVDQFNVTLTHPTLLPGTFSGTLNLGPSMTGIRSARGGTLVIPSKTFP